MKNKIPKISIILLNFNGLNYIQKTIPAIINLNYKNKEIVIVDNGSNDGSIEYISSYKEIKLINNNSNLGYSKGKNIGVNNSTGEFILLLDNDILIDIQTDLYELLCFHEMYSNSFISIPLKDIDKDYINYRGGYINYFTEGFFYSFNKKKVNKLGKLVSCNVAFPNGGAIFFQRKLWNVLGGFDENQSFNIDDRDLGIRAYLYGYDVILFDKFYFEHLGVNHKFNFYTWIWKFKLEYSGNMRIIIKNLKIKNVMICIFTLTIYTFGKAIKQSIFRLSFLPFFAFLSSFFLFIKNLPDTMNERKIIQSNRKINEDIFLKIKQPKID